jgi:uncharacterized protein YbbC (DUF1343 family)
MSKSRTFFIEKVVFKIMISFAVFTLIPGIFLHAQDNTAVIEKDIYPQDIKVGAERTNLYFPWIIDKNIAVVANQTSMIGNVHLVDSLLKAGMKIRKVFCPEHGFRGQAEAGANIETATDKTTGLSVVSLYGKKLKPSAADLKDVDVVVFDIQDVGARFYTYISTLHYVMEACAENKKTLIVLDRPNPNGHYVDGPVLEKGFSSFIGMDPVPIVHGMTMAQYACMLNDEGWLKNAVKCDLKYVTVFNYNHTYYYHLPVKPSPNLPNMSSVWLYPTLCLFEGTVISVGRGTDKPFQVIGSPKIVNANSSFTPHDIPGMATNPMYKDQICYGYDLSDFSEAYIKNSGKLYLFWLLEAYKQLKDKGDFFYPTFDKLAGTAKFRQQIINGLSEDEIRKSWEPDITAFKKIRKKYLLYPDFE